MEKTAIVIGAGIVGLATARSLAEKGYKVQVFERNHKAVGASVRNFGMIWPIGQPEGPLYRRAQRSKAIWKTVCQEAGLWYNETGSLHLAYSDLEWQVLNELEAAFRQDRDVCLLTKDQTSEKSGAVNKNGLKGALWSPEEMIVESRVAIDRLPAYLSDKYNVAFHFGTCINSIEHPVVYSGTNSWRADIIFVCSGADFETLYPEVFQEHYMTKCKLQMMRIEAQPADWHMGPFLCGGLSLIHYKSFEAAKKLPELRRHYEETLPDYIRWGIHVMVSQNAAGELTIGDSHEYASVFDPFDKAHINKLIIGYLQQFAHFKKWDLLQSWHGIYPKRTDGHTELICQPASGVTILNGLGGAGMTLSFGLAEEVVATL